MLFLYNWFFFSSLLSLLGLLCFFLITHMCLPKVHSKLKPHKEHTPWLQRRISLLAENRTSEKHKQGRSEGRGQGNVRKASVLRIPSQLWLSLKLSSHHSMFCINALWGSNLDISTSSGPVCFYMIAQHKLCTSLHSGGPSSKQHKEFSFFPGSSTWARSNYLTALDKRQISKWGLFMVYWRKLPKL